MVSCFQSICKRCPASLFWGLLPFCIQESGICLDFLQGFFCPALPFPPFAGNPPSISQHLILYFPARKRSSFDLSTFDEGFLGSSLDLSTLDQGFLSSIDFSTLFGGIRPLFLEKLWWGFLKMFAPSRSFFYFFCPSAPSVLHTRPTSLRGEFPRRWHTVNPFYAFEISPRIVSRVRKFCIF